MHEHYMSPGFKWGLAWARALNRIDGLEERQDRLEATVARISQDVDGMVQLSEIVRTVQPWARRIVILLAIWGSLGLAGLNHEQASDLVATVIKAMTK